MYSYNECKQEITSFKVEVELELGLNSISTTETPGSAILPILSADALVARALPVP